jgi:Na+/citrate or Na+/malate symporter
MVQQIVTEAEPPGATQSTFRLSIDANLIAKGVTVAQAYYLVGEVLGQFLLPEHAEPVTFDTDGVER